MEQVGAGLNRLTENSLFGQYRCYNFFIYNTRFLKILLLGQPVRSWPHFDPVYSRIIAKRISGEENLEWLGENIMKNTLAVFEDFMIRRIYDEKRNMEFLGGWYCWRFNWTEKFSNRKKILEQAEREVEKRG